MRGKSKIIVAAVALIAALLTPIIGPFTFYESVVPFLAPVLPKPDGVPKSASASYNWKGFGLFWQWDQPLSSGCAKWAAAETMNYYSVQLTAGQEGCNSASIPLTLRAYSDHIVFGQGGNWAGGESCPFKVSSAQIAAFESLLQEAKMIATPAIELRALRQIEARLSSVNGDALTTDHTGGCNDLALTDYEAHSPPNTATATTG